MNLQRIDVRLQEELLAVSDRPEALLPVFVEITRCKNGWKLAKAHRLNPISHDLCTGHLTAAEIARLSDKRWVRRLYLPDYYNPHHR